MWKVRHREVKSLTPDHTARKWQSCDLNTGDPWKTAGTRLWGTFRVDYYKAVKCGFLGGPCLLQNMSVDFLFL